MAFHCIKCKTEIDKSYKACPHCGEVVTDFLRTYSEAPIDGKYQITERLGQGGMGEVYKVTHIFLGATRVIKVIRAQISDNKDAHDRFLKEAKIATRIQHPNVATLHDFSALPDGSHYMVWEYIEGEDLSHRIRGHGRLQPRYAVRLAIEALHGLDGIHRAGIVHRDISPENIMITRDGDEERVKVIDLGVAKSEDPADGATKVGIFVGKLRYASPEHLGFLNEGERIDGRADLYSMAMVLYETLMGRPPFEATSPHEYVMLHSKETQFKPLDLPPDLPGGAELQAVLKKALEHDRDKRYANAREFIAALESAERSLPDPKTMETMMNMPVDATMHVTPLSSPDTYHRETVRSQVRDSGPTIQTAISPARSTAGPTTVVPQPGYVPAAPTQYAEVVAQPRKGGGVAIAITIALLLLVIAGIGGFLAYKKFTTGPTQIAEKPRTETIEPRPPVISTATVEVSTTESGSSTATGTIVETPTDTGGRTLVDPGPNQTDTILKRPSDGGGRSGQNPGGDIRPRPQPQPPAPQPYIPPPPEPQPRPQPQPQPSSVRTYIDGDNGDSDANDPLLANLRDAMRGVNRVAVRGGDPAMNAALVDRLGKDAALSVSDSAPVVIDWDATLEQVGRGSRRRAATATVSKNGRVVFKYELPSEIFRSGDTPAQAFARVFALALGQ